MFPERTRRNFQNLLTFPCIQLQGSLALQAAGVPRRHVDIVGCSGKLSTCYMPPPLARLLMGLTCISLT